MRNRGVRFVDYPTLARQFALLQSSQALDALRVPVPRSGTRAHAAPAQLTMQAAMDRPLDVCGGEGVR